MPSARFSTVATATAAACGAAMLLGGFTDLGNPPRLYTPDTIPNQPVEPYAMFQLVESGYGWDPGLAAAGVCGWPDLQVTGVARMQQAAAWVLDSVRSYLRELDPATVAVGGGTTVRALSSAGPPTSMIEAGTLWNTVEIWNLYVEAS